MAWGWRFVVSNPEVILCSKPTNLPKTMCLKALHMTSMNLGESTIQYRNNINNFMLCIVVLRSITMFCGTHNISQNILYIHYEYWKYFMEYCHSHITLLRIWKMLCVCYWHQYMQTCASYIKSVCVWIYEWWKLVTYKYELSLETRVVVSLNYYIAF
jgi:hypothetical protein